ncbi:MAG TPA: Crp/Fnr family transcriptional regulator, partial [Thermaerobacter sp.]
GRPPVPGPIPRPGPAVTASDWRWALQHAQVRRWRPGQVLHPGPGRPAGIHWLGHGTVRLATADAAGELRLLALVTGPGLVGDPGPLFGREPVPLVGTCLTPCQTAFWPYPVFAQLLEQRPGLAVLLAHQGMDLFHQAAWRVAGLLWPCSRLRILHVLVTLARAFPLPGTEGSRLPASLTQQAIGLAANASRVSVNRVLADLRRRGLVGRARPLYIRDTGRLEALLQEEILAAGEPAAPRPGEGRNSPAPWDPGKGA